MTEPWSQLVAQMVEQGQAMVRALNPALETFRPQGYEDLIPTLPKEVMEMAFGKTFNREGLDAKTRMLLSIAALTVLGARAEPQLKLCVRHAREAGATRREIAETIFQMSLFAGLPAMQRALEIAEAAFPDTPEDRA